MAVLGFGSKVVRDFRGAWTRVTGTDLRADRAFVAQNVRLTPRRVASRPGLVNRAALTAKCTAIYSWLGSNFNFVLLWEGTSARLYNIASSTFSTLYTEATARAMVVAESATRAVLASFKTDGLGAGSAYVINGGIVGIPADKAFAKPFQVTTQTHSEPNAGNVTAGTHYFGFIGQSRTGFLGRPSPVDSLNTFVPFSATAAGSKTSRYQVTFTTAADSSFVYPIMTRADNPNRWYYVPQAFGGSPIALPPSIVGWIVTWDLNISDENLAAFATEVVDEFDVLVQDQSGGPPFSPNAVKAYGKRMVYIAGADLYFSEEDKPQHVTAAFHLRRTPEERPLLNALVVRGVLYAIGTNWAYSFTDRAGQDPVAWPSPQRISDRIGAMGVLAMTDRTGGDRGWVAHESGLWYFDGRFASKPISFMQEDWWKRINLAFGHTVHVIEDILERKVMVLAPLDGATEPNYLLIWDFSRGFDPMEVDFTWDIWPSGSGRSAVAFVTEANKRQSLWLGPVAAGQIQRYVEGTRDDAGSAIDCQYQTGHLLAEGEGDQINWIGNPMIDISGSGSADVTVLSPAQTRSVAQTVTLEPGPDFEAHVKVRLSMAETASIKIRTNAVGAWFDLKKVRIFYRRQATNK